MTLFNDTEIFRQGSAGKKIFALPDAELMLIDRFFNKAESDDYYDMLLHHTPWQEYQMPMYDKIVTAPRMICWYQDKTDDGVESHLELTPELSIIRERVESTIGEKFNAVLLNLYRNGKDSVAWHSDKEGRIGRNPSIASVTFGETRLFRLRHKTRQDIGPINIPLHHGSLLLMAGTTNTFWEHQVPKTTREVLPRVNLTFRQVG